MNRRGLIPVGLICLVAAFPLLFWNEGRAVKTARALAEGVQKVVSISSEGIDPASDGELVHVTGSAQTRETLFDDVLSVSTEAIKLRRSVEMFQWRENSSSRSDDTSTVDYELVWSDELIPSSGFRLRGHDNPFNMPFESDAWTAKEVALGDFWLSDNLIGKINAYEPVRFQENIQQTLRQNLGVDNVYNTGEYLFLAFAAGTPSQPQVGDVRVKLEQVLDRTVSVVAEQRGNSFAPFNARSGRNLEMLRLGSLSSEEMFEVAVSENIFLTWALRVVGFLVMAAGLRFLFSPLVALTRFIPGLGNLARLGVNMLSVLLALAFSLSTASFAWLTYRPLIGLPLLVLAIAGVFVAKRVADSRARAATRYSQ